MKKRQHSLTENRLTYPLLGPTGDYEKREGVERSSEMPDMSIVFGVFTSFFSYPNWFPNWPHAIAVTPFRGLKVGNGNGLDYIGRPRSLASAASSLKIFLLTGSRRSIRRLGSIFGIMLPTLGSQNCLHVLWFSRDFRSNFATFYFIFLFFKRCMLTILFWTCGSRYFLETFLLL